MATPVQVTALGPLGIPSVEVETPRIPGQWQDYPACCIDGFKADSNWIGQIYTYEALTGQPGVEATSRRVFGMSGDGTRIVEQVQNLQSRYNRAGWRVLVRSGEDWVTEQEIIDPLALPSARPLKMSTNGEIFITSNYNVFAGGVDYVPAFIRVYRKYGTVWVNDADLDINFDDDGTTVYTLPEHSRVVMSDDGEIIAYANYGAASLEEGPTLHNHLIVWDHGTKHVIIRPIEEPDYGFSVGISGNGQYIFLGASHYAANSSTTPSYITSNIYPDGITVSPGAILVYEKVEGTWTEVAVMAMPQAQVEAVCPPWVPITGGQAEIAASYDGSVVAYSSILSNYYVEIPAPDSPGDYGELLLHEAGLVQMFRKEVDAWDFEQVLFNPHRTGIGGWPTEGSAWFGHSLSMSSAGDKLLVGTQLEEAATLWSYSGTPNPWNLLRTFDASDNMQDRASREVGVGGVSYVTPTTGYYGLAVNLSRDGDFAVVMEPDYARARLSIYDASSVYVQYIPRFWCYAECTS